MLTVIYFLIGIGLYGGWPHWSEGGRLIYTIFFPLHVLTIDVVKHLTPAVNGIFALVFTRTFWCWATMILVFLMLLSAQR